MKYSVRGSIATIDGSGVVSVINQYVLWRLVTNAGDSFMFEAWVNTETDKTALFNTLKTFVNAYTGEIDWHMCSHDESTTTPCVISETYTGG